MRSQKMQFKKLRTDVLIIGGGTAGCYAAMTIAQNSPDTKVLICEKANIKRSGCLAAGVNALNAYITKGCTPQDYVDYARHDAAGIVRGDLLLTMSENLNSVTAHLEQLGLVILKDENGNYVTRGKRNLKINGAFGFNVNEEIFYSITAKAVIICTGGAAGLYKPNNPGFSRHKMWYPPFNTGAGYAMGIRAGAEMTTFEMRFIALRCKDTIAPTGTLAQGVGAKQINSLGGVYEDKYGLTTSQRVHGTVMENISGRGPCYLKTAGITAQQDDALIKAYLNMAPSQTIKWLESGKMPSEQNVEIEGTEPYIVGGHTASGYWVDTDRETTIHGLFAAGDVAGGCPQKYVTGALAEGRIAALSALKYIAAQSISEISDEKISENFSRAEKFLNNKNSRFSCEQLEEAMQTVMDRYAGGIGTNYRYNDRQLDIADERISQIQTLTDELCAEDMHELMLIYELRERLTVCKTLIAHLRARKETRWHSFAENLDYPQRDDENYLCCINSKLENGRIKIIKRRLIKEGERYEHNDRP